MRTVSAAQDKVLLGSGVSQPVRVSVKDGSGTWRDLTTYPGRNMLKAVEWGENTDDAFAACTVTLIRELDALSLAPLMQSSPLNRGFNPAASYAALLALNREIKVEAATVGADMTPGASDWETFFHGYVDSIDAGQGADVVVQARDLGSALMDRFIEWERVYNWGSDSGTPVGIRIWGPSEDFALNEYVAPTDGRRDAARYFYKCTTAGTTGTTEPTTWPSSSTVSSGTATFTYVGTITNAGVAVESTIQAILNAEGLSAVTLVTSGSPSWTILQYKQQREPVLEAVRRLAQQIGWEVRYRWNSGAGAFRLTLYQPERTSPSVARSFGASDYKQLGSVAVENSSIRNRVRVVYSDSADKDSAGNARRKAVTVQDSTSIAAFGTRFMEVAESSSSNIDSSSEATTMANAALKDLKDPIIAVTVALSFGFPWAELQDYYTLSANGRHFSAAQSLAVSGIRHRAENGVLRTELTLRGLPALGPSVWEGISSRAKPEDAHSLSGAQGTGGLTLEASGVVGGTRLKVKPSTISGWTLDPQAFPEEYDWHVSQSSGFTPDSSSYKGTTQGQAIELADLIPGATYYTKVLPKLRNAGRLVLGQPSTQLQFTAGRGNAGHLNTDVNWSRIPLNGGFETQTDANGPPDHWSVGNNTVWVTNASLVNDGSGKSGGYYLKIEADDTDSNSLVTDYFPVEEGITYRLEVWEKNVAGTGQARVHVAWHSYNKSYISIDVNLVDVNLTTSTGTWVKYVAFVTAPSSAKFAVMYVGHESNNAAAEEHWDSVTMEPIRPAGQWTFTADAMAATNATEYASVGYMGSGGAFATEFRWYVTHPGVISDLRVYLGAAGTNMDYAYTVRKNGSDTALTCSTTAGGTTASDTTHAFTVAAGDYISLKVVSTQNGGGVYAGAGDASFTMRHSY